MEKRPYRKIKISLAHNNGKGSGLESVAEGPRASAFAMPSLHMEPFKVPYFTQKLGGRGRGDRVLRML